MMSAPRMSKASVACLALFAIISALVSTGTTHDWDVAVLQWFGSWRTPPATDIMQFISNIGNWYGEIPLLLLVAGLLLARGRRASAWRFIAVALGAEGLYAVAKLLFHRARPTVLTHLSDAGWYSYPSGHSLVAPVIWGGGLVLCAQLVERRGLKRALIGAAVIMPIAIATSRVYLGVHYATDVLGGLALGMAWLLIWWGAVSDTTARH